MYGDELLDPELLSKFPDAHSCWVQNDAYRLEHSFLGQLGKHYDVPIENFGIPGGSLQSSIWTYLWWIEHEPNLKDCLVLVGHTDSDRLSFYNPKHVHFDNDPPWNKFVHSTWVKYGSSVVPNAFVDLTKKHMVLTSCAELNKLNYLQTAMFFDGQAARHSVPLMQFHIMPAEKELNLPSMIWPNFATTLWFRDHPENRRKELIKPGGHPNERGHKMLADKLIETIDSATM